MWPAIIGGIAALAGAANANSASRSAVKQQQQFQSSMSNTSYQRAVSDMSAAGLNPMLAYQQGGASTPSGASYTPQNEGAAALQGASSAAAASNMEQQNELLKAQTEKTIAEKAFVQAQTLGSTASAGYTVTQTEKLKQDMQKFEDELRLLRSQADTAHYGAGIRLDDAEISRGSWMERLKGAKAKAQQMVYEAEMAGLEVPRWLNEAAFESSPMGKGIRYVERGAGVLGSVVGSAGGVRSMLRPDFRPRLRSYGD